MSQVEGISTVIPKERFDLSSLGNLFGEKNVRRIMKSTGIHELRIAPPDKTASDYCAEAAETLIEKIGIDRNEIDGLIFVSHSPDYLDPNTSAILQHRLNLSNKIITMDLNFGCTGFVNGMFMANVWINSGACRNVLLLVGDTFTRKINPLDRLNRMMFGDASSATLITASEDPMQFATYVDGSRFDRLMIPAGGARVPHKSGVTDVTHEAEDGNSRSQEDHFMDGMAMFNFVLDEVPRVINEVLEKSNWRIDDVDLFAIHQVNRSTLTYLARTMNLPLEKTPFEVENYGNSVSASIPVMLAEKFGGIDRDFSLDRVVACGFGSGLSCSALTMNLSQTTILPILEM